MYDQLVDLYDWEHAGFQDDIPMYLAYATGRRGEILDAACGTGRVTIPLAKAGCRVTGVDSSAGMLEVARRRVLDASLGRRARLVQGDIRRLDLGRQFVVALVALGSFHHLLSLEDQRLAFSSLARHVAPGGLLILDLANPTPEWLAAADGTVVHQLTAPYPNESGPDTMSKFVVRIGSFDRQSERQILMYDLVQPGGTMIRRVFEMEMRYLFRYEAELLLEAAGFSQRDTFGNYSLDPYGADSPRMILVAERK